MKDLGIMGIQKIDTSKPEYKAWFGLRKLFWTYLKKLNVPFYDVCCDAADAGHLPVGINKDTGVLEQYDPETKTWIAYEAPTA